MLSLVLPKLLAAAGVVGGLLALLIGVRRSGRQSQQLDDERRAGRNADVRRKIEEDTAGRSDDAVSDDLRRWWRRR